MHNWEASLDFVVQLANPVVTILNIGELHMNKEQIQGNWNQIKGRIKQKWGKLTNDDLDVIEGQDQELAGILEKRYGIAKEMAEKQAKEFYESCGCG